MAGALPSASRHQSCPDHRWPVIGGTSGARDRHREAVATTIDPRRSGSPRSHWGSICSYSSAPQSGDREGTGAAIASVGAYVGRCDPRS
jgi:hypothetical protein